MNDATQHQPTPSSNDSEFVLDLDSDEPVQVCPMRKDGMAPGDICESCQ